MNFLIFKNELEKAIKEIPGIPENIVFTQTAKNNGVITEYICFKDDACISPSIGLNYFYDEYLKGRDIDDIAHRISEIYFSTPKINESDFNLNRENAKSHVVYHIINYSANKTTLANIPHLRVLEFAIIFKISTDYLGINGYLTVNNTILDTLQIPITELVETALDNTERLLPLHLKNLKEVLPEIPDFAESDLEVPDEPKLWVCTNKEKLHGASSIFYDELATQLEILKINDCFVLPASIHEVLLIPCDGTLTHDGLTGTVKEVNKSTLINNTEFLSDSVHTYRELRKAFENTITEFRSNHPCNS